MNKFMGAVIFGAAVGASLVFALMSGSSRLHQQQPIARDIAVSPAIAEAELEAMRETRFEDLNSVEAIMSLPTAFSRAEALHALAGRVSAGRVQQLIYEAARVRNDAERDGAMKILFARLADVDPRTAVALAGLDELSTGNKLESHVWQYWSRMDFDAALSAAEEIDDPQRRRAAAQALFAANGFYATPEVARIEARLGIQPDHTNRVQHVYQLMESSPDAALALLNDMPYGAEKQQFIASIAGYFSSSDIAAAREFALRIKDNSTRITFDRIVAGLDAQSRPEETLEELLQSRSNPNDGRLYSAAQALASSDLDRALQFYAAADTPAKKQMIGMAVAQQFAKQDPDAALQWAREFRSTGGPRFGSRSDLMAVVIGTIAREDPDRAIAEIKAQPKSRRRDQLVQQVVMTLTMTNPVRAMEMVDEVDVANSQMSSRNSVFNMWARTDPQAAADWLATNSDEMNDGELSRLGATLADADVDLAMQLLPQFDESSAGRMRGQIAQQLVARGSIAEAAQFIERYRNTDQHAALQRTLIQGVAQTDPARAEQLAQQLPAGAERDTAYTSLVYAASGRSPADAVRLLDQIESSELRQQTGSVMIRGWANSDPAAAVDWLLSRPANAERDQMLIQVAANLAASETSPQRIYNAISNPARRSQAETNYIMGLVQRDPAMARSALASSSLDENARKQVLTVIDRYEKGVISSYSGSFPVID